MHLQTQPTTNTCAVSFCGVSFGLSTILQRIVKKMQSQNIPYTTQRCIRISTHCIRNTSKYLPESRRKSRCVVCVSSQFSKNSRAAVVRSRERLRTTTAPRSHTIYQESNKRPENRPIPRIPMFSFSFNSF